MQLICFLFLLFATTAPAAAPDAKSSANHWAFRELMRPEVPKIPNSVAQPQNPIDAFIAAKLAERGLAMSPPADPRTVIRRLKFNLLGLPPTPEEVAEFERECAAQNSDSKNAKRGSLPNSALRIPHSALTRLVTRYLASPHYGERWARHWLDVVRFAESNGFEMNQVRKNAWPYRDYVIRAFNDDKPYDRFITEQLAGDSLGVDEATAFIVAGAWDQVKSPDPVLTANQRADELHDMVSTTASAFLALTVNCARCHDHKFDPISMTDYYAMIACFAGVQHGERALRPAGQRETDKLPALRKQLAEIDRELARFEPLAHAGRTRVIFTDDAEFATALLPSRGEPAKYPEGTLRGAAGDTGDGARLPNFGKGYLYWNGVAGRDVFAWRPKLEGRFRIWLSWGAGHAAHATDARYVLDADGDSNTRGDQTEIARANHQKFADASGAVPERREWSGFFDAGLHTLKPSSALLLRGGAGDAYVTADVAVFQEVSADDEAPARAAAPRVRVPVTRGKNVESFAPLAARFVRFTILDTTQSQPCIDELEAFTAEATPRNVALASAGGRATASSTLPGHAIHKLEHINDGRYGNEWSWISNEPRRGWVQIEFAREEKIDRVVWSRDRSATPRFTDRVATRYTIETSLDGKTWRRAASSDDRLAMGTTIPGGTIYSTTGLRADDAGKIAKLIEQRKSLETQISSAAGAAMVYAGKFVAAPETHRMNRGDPTQPREVVAPGALEKFGAKLAIPEGTPEADRRLALARWIADPRHPLTARVMVNRIWHYHFGRGIVDTPSDFGINGARPSHPELLDWLAGEFIASGWSVKHIQKLIVTSEAFRQGGVATGLGAEQDAANRLLWHFPARRLEAEALRDTLLAVSGKLNPTMGGPGFDLFVPNTSYVKVYVPKQEFATEEFRRMVYQSKPRMQLDDVFGAFDCPDAGQIAPRRNASTTALQALNLLNSRFMVQLSEQFAARVAADAGNAADAQARRAFALAFTRQPDAMELRGATELIAQHGLAALCRALFNANEFVSVF